MFFRRSPSAAVAPLYNEELLARYRTHGKVADLGQLYDRYLPEAFVVCRRYLADEDAQDATTQLFEHLIKILRTHAPNNFPSWLHATARNYYLMQLRTRKRAGPSADPLILSFPDAANVENAAARHLPDEAVAAEEAKTGEARLQSMAAALAQLAPAQRRCLELFYFEKKCYRDIVTETDLEINLVRSHLQNGKRMLPRQLESPAPASSSSQSAAANNSIHVAR